MRKTYRDLPHHPLRHDDTVSLQADLERLAEGGDFSGVIGLSRNGERFVELHRGLADRANSRPIRLDTRFGIASVTKGLTALTVASLIESRQLRYDTTLRRLLPRDLPMVDPRVTIEHLLGHTSGVGDYLDEETQVDIDDYVMDLPVHRLANPADYLPLLDGHPQRSPPGNRFTYNNSGYVMLSIAAEVAGAASFYDLVQKRVLDPSAMADTRFVRSDRLPEVTAAAGSEVVLSSSVDGPQRTGRDAKRGADGLHVLRNVAHVHIHYPDARSYDRPSSAGLALAPFGIGQTHGSLRLRQR